MAKENVIEFVRPEAALAEEGRRASAIVAGIRSGDGRAEAEMVERYSKGLGYLISRKIGDKERARDLLQETFCIALEKLRTIKLDNPERLAGYLRGIAVRVVMHANRRRNREPIPVESDVVVGLQDNQPQPFQRVSSEQTLAAVTLLLQSMPVERDRDLLLRFYVYDQDKQDICDALDLDSLHFNRVLFRAKARFRKLLAQCTDEFGQPPGE